MASSLAASGGREQASPLGRPGDEDREVRQKAWLFMSSLFLLPTSFFSYPSVTREGVSRGTRGGDTPPTPCFMASQDDGSGGPEKGGGMSTVRMCH